MFKIKQNDQAVAIDVEKIIDEILNSSISSNSHPARRVYPDTNLYNDTVIERADNKYIDPVQQRTL